MTSTTLGLSGHSSGPLSEGGDDPVCGSTGVGRRPYRIPIRVESVGTTGSSRGGLVPDTLVSR